RLPVFDGPDGSHAEITHKYFQFKESLSLIGRQIKRVEVSERRAWRLHLDDKTIVELGRKDVVARL
ncbi:MAG: cell division protein FtsQ, partial [Burkholderiales bacterium]|nr:cell division protein FtsQ [Burkholderiales bacterium]